MPQSGVGETFKSSVMAEYTSFVKGVIKYEVVFPFFPLLSMILVLKICIISVLVLLASTDYQGSS